MTSTQKIMEARLVDTVRRLASPADEQRVYIEELGTAPLLDELALELDAVFAGGRTEFLQRAPFSAEALEAVARLDSHLSTFSGPANPDLWLVSSLTAPEWETTRRLARDALSLLEGSVGSNPDD
jgi:hypothetical protein